MSQRKYVENMTDEELQAHIAEVEAERKRRTVDARVKTLVEALHQTARNAGYRIDSMDLVPLDRTPKVNGHEHKATSGDVMIKGHWRKMRDGRRKWVPPHMRSARGRHANAD